MSMSDACGPVHCINRTMLHDDRFAEPCLVLREYVLERRRHHMGMSRYHFAETDVVPVGDEQQVPTDQRGHIGQQAERCSVADDPSRWIPLIDTAKGGIRGTRELLTEIGSGTRAFRERH